MRRPGLPRLLKIMVWSQGIYYTSTGIWPLVHMASFIAVTGPKTDLWLVKMVGLLAVAIGICLLFSARRKEFPPLLFVLAVSTALAFVLIDSIYGYTGVIAPVYLADAVVQLAFSLAYAVSFIRREPGPGFRPPAMWHGNFIADRTKQEGGAGR